ncbi:MAG: YqjK-like family protein [Proteobacteria bacterium]|nr:YqjK-like family protein [Pseudomonadota bacterium]
MPIRLNEENGGRMLTVHVSGKLIKKDYEHFVPEFEAQALREKLSLFDIGLNLLERLKKNPALITGLVVGLIVIKPRRLLPVLQNSLLAWQALRGLAPTMKNIMECRRENTPTIGSSL